MCFRRKAGKGKLTILLFVMFPAFVMDQMLLFCYISMCLSWIKCPDIDNIDSTNIKLLHYCWMTGLYLAY